MALSRNAGDVKINGVPYRISTDEKGTPLYKRVSVPKYDVRLSKSNASSSENNIIEYRYSAAEGYGDAVQTKNLQRYHWAGNLFMEHENEAVLLVDETFPVWVNTGVQQALQGPASVAFEIVINENDATKLQTWVLQDTFAGTITFNDTIDVQKVFEDECTPTDAIVVDNTAYVAMGSNFRHMTIISHTNSAGNPRFTTGSTNESGSTLIPTAHNYGVGDLIRIANCNQTVYNGIWIVTAVPSTTSFEVANLNFTALAVGTNITGTTYKIDKRYVRKMKGGVWSRDDNNYIAITAAALGSAGTGTLFTTGVNHLYTVGTKVYLVDMSVAGYNSMSTSDVSTIYTITEVPAPNQFEIEAITFSANAVGAVNAQESDIHAEHFCFAGDLLIRGFKDANLGWCTSRVDPISSNPMLDANWTEGIGTVGVGDANSAITDLVALGEGEVVMKSEGVYTYKREQSAFTNEIPELNEHRHPRNGKNSVEHKGWVYVPTAIGLLRYRNGQIQNVTPGRDGQQKYMTPVLPIGGVVGDAERLYAITEPFKAFQHKQLTEIKTKIYVDYAGAGTADTGFDWSQDPQIDLNGLTTAGYIYLGAKQPWHMMYIEMDDIYNTLLYGSTYSGLKVMEHPQYWNGTSWVSRTLLTGGFSTGGGGSTDLTDFTRVRNSSANTHSTLGTSGEWIFWGAVPGDWDTGGTVPLGTDLGTTNEFYWCRFALSADIVNSVIIKRISAGVHDTLEQEPYDALDFGGVQLVLSMTEEAGKGPIWHTMWALTPVEDMNNVPGMLPFGNSSAGRLPPCSSVGTLAIVQPNIFRSGATGERFLFLGGWKPILFSLGNKQDPTEAGVWYNNQYPKAVLVMPDTDCGLPYTDKELREINFSVENIDLADIVVWWRNESGVWEGGITPTSLPIKISQYEQTITGQRFGVAIEIAVTNNSNVYTFPYSPRLTTLPAIRVIPRPEMSEYIEMSVDLDADLQMRGKIDRREEKTSYLALKNLLNSLQAVPYIDVDDTVEKVHVIQVGKSILFSSDNKPRSVANLVMSVFEPDAGDVD